jgi:hypothetical protein
MKIDERHEMNEIVESSRESNTTLRGRWLLAARLAWFIIVTLTIVLFVIAIPYQIEQDRILCSGSACLGNSGNQLSQSDLQQLQQAGLSLDFYVGFIISIQIISALIFLVVAAIIFWRRSNDWMGIFVSLELVLFGIAGSSGLLDPLSLHLPALQFPVLFVEILKSIGLLFLLFPDGRFVPRWTRWIAPFIVLRNALGIILPNSQLIGDLFFLELAIPFFAQIYRYWRVSNTEQRLQTKWVIFGITVVVLTRFGILFPVIFESPPVRPSGLSFLIFISALELPALAIPLSIGIAILRFHLWNIDILIRRTLIYTTLTASLALVYFASVLVLQKIFRLVTGDTAPIVIVLSTLAIAALFTPLRKRLQDFIDRRFYRRKYDSARTLQAFSTAARDEVELEKLTILLVSAASEAMQPVSLSFWLKPLPGTRPALPKQKQSESQPHNLR